jgi:phage/plasmid-like protein (TIGR03299 family)
MKSNELDQSGAGMLRAVNGEALDSMMSVGDETDTRKLPWHYAQNKDMILRIAKDRKITSKEVNKAAGLDWNVYQTPAFIYPGEMAEARVDANGYVIEPDISQAFKLVGTQREEGKQPVPDYYLNVRDDIHRVIGIVKKRYRIFQNVEAPIFLDNLVDSGDAVYETAGSLHGGSQVWWLMKLPEGVNVAGDPREKVETYILLTNSHDGSTSIVVAVVPIRVVCQNTLAWSLKKAIRTTKVKHTGSAKEQFMEARRTLEIGFTYQAELAELGDRMLHTSFSEAEFKAFLDSLVPTPEPVTKDNRVSNQRGITMADNTKGGITQIYFNSDTQTNIEGTLWGAVQACQFYSDHMSISRNTDDSSADENRFKRLTSGRNLGNEAFAQALALL